MPRPAYSNIDEYIGSSESSVQPILQEIREFIKKLAPDAKEKISWSMPTFYLNGNLIHFMAHKKHIGIYPGVSGIENFINDFEERGFKYSKGAVQFPLDKPIPWDLLQRIVEFRIKESM